MTDNQRKAVTTLMGKTQAACEKAMGEQFCSDHKGDCEQCLNDFMDMLFENTTGCKCQWCQKQGCGTYHSQCEHYKAFLERKEMERKDKMLRKKCRYYSKKGKGA